MKNASRLMDLLYGPNRFGLLEQFVRLPQTNNSVGIAANPDFELIGTNAADEDVVFSNRGGVVLSTNGAQNDYSALWPHQDTSQSLWAKSGLWNTGKQLIFNALIRTDDASGVTSKIWAGLKKTHTPVIATDSDQVFVFYDSGGTYGDNWWVAHSRSGVDLETESEVAVEPSTEYEIGIEIDADRRISVFINNKTVYSQDLRSPLTDNVNLFPVVGVQCLQSAAVESIECRYLMCSRIVP